MVDHMVYKSFGSKAALAKAVIDVALAGDDEPVPVRERPAVQVIHDEPDVRRKIALFVEGLLQRLERSASMQIVVRDGRHVDESLQPVWERLNGEGLTGMRLFGEHLLSTGQLRAGLDLDEVTDVLWNYLAIDHYERLVMVRGWSPTRFQAWLTRAIIGALCDEG
jgi:AcrR family transcriptional regulator